MSQPEQISFVALGVMIVLSIGIALWVRYVRRSIVSAPRLFQSAGVGGLHVLGCVVFLVLGAGQSAIAQALALFSLAVFLLVTCVALFQRSRLNLHIAGMSALLSLVWLAYWVHETQLAVWMGKRSTRRFALIYSSRRLSCTSRRWFFCLWRSKASRCRDRRHRPGPDRLHRVERALTRARAGLTCARRLCRRRRPSRSTRAPRQAPRTRTRDRRPARCGRRRSRAGSPSRTRVPFARALLRGAACC